MYGCVLVCLDTSSLYLILRKYFKLSHSEFHSARRVDVTPARGDLGILEICCTAMDKWP